ncbi:hypothetical protein [Paenibacillus sp. MBLB4367]|uniref:hypothetical protein n=1 Tax=Paenibacillus sp. MBLB4367 TaxID=3384767 RepID=UPI00390810AC
MKKIRKRLLPVVLLAAVAAGCTDGLTGKTVIIPDSEETQERSAGNEEFAVKKMYKLLENEDSTGELLGWAGHNQVLGAFGRRGGPTGIELVDYVNRSRQKVAEVNGQAEVTGASPDGAFVTTVWEENGKEQLAILQLATNKELRISDFADGSMRKSAVTWSNNSRYVAYVKGKRKQTEAQIVVYDVSGQTRSEYTIDRTNAEYSQFDIKISDDGKSALICNYSGSQSAIVYGKIAAGVFTGQFEQLASSEAGMDFVSENQFVYVGAQGTLTLYDTRKASSFPLVEQIGTFRVSADRKYIAYSKGRENIFVVKLQGNAVMNEKSIYKGLIPLHMDWSPDSKKLLVYGRKSYPAPAPALRPAVVLPDQPPYIIEFY